VNEGKIVEQGKHEELLKAGGLYSELHKLQFKGEEAA
jgi:ABC-type multidrug transport system fused ATPase/permease subunit